MKVFKYLLLISIFFLSGLQIVQRYFVFLPQTRLIGVADTSHQPHFTPNSYYAGKFQPAFETFTEEKMGFRSTLIRLRNQFDYSVFNYTQAPGVVIGKNGMLFIESYIQNYKGSVFKGKEVIQNEVRRLKMIQDELKKHNVDFLLIFAPGKATFYAEQIPGRYQQRPITNYQYYIKALSGSGINFIDMNAWFLKLKGKTKYPLYPLNGTHWSTYGIGLAADSMFRYIEKLRNIELPNFSWDRVVVSDSMRYADNDVGELLNLWHPVKPMPMPYPHFIYKQEGKMRPRVIAIGDSYWWGFTGTKITENVFEKDRYWFYFRDMKENETPAGLVASVDLKDQLFKQDLVILMVTEATYQLFPYGFIEDFYEKCMPVSQEVLQIRLEKYIVKIKNDPTWYRNIEEKAKENGTTVDEQLMKDARYMVDQEQK